MARAARLRIWVFNLKNGAAHFPERLENIATLAGRIDKNQGVVSDVFGLSECRYERITDLGDARQKYRKKKIPCGDTRRLTPHCLGVHWSDELGKSVSLIHDQFGELGILANGDTLKLNSSFFHKKILKRGVAGRGTPILLLGVRLRIKNTPCDLPFYVTHLRGDKLKACKNIMRHIQNTRQRGDLPPILVGDFNMDYGRAHDAMAHLDAHFDEMGLRSQQTSIDQCWVGDGDVFQDSPWVFTLSSFRTWDGFSDDAVNYSDHAGKCIELLVHPRRALLPIRKTSDWLLLSTSTS